MNSDQVFMAILPKALAITVIVNLVFIIFFLIVNVNKKNKFIRLVVLIIAFNAIPASIIMTLALMFSGNVTYNKVELPREVIVSTEVVDNVVIETIEEGTITMIPTIMLPVSPEGKEIVVIDTYETGDFVDLFYDENNVFFNEKIDVTYFFGTELENVPWKSLQNGSYSSEMTEEKRILDLTNEEYDFVWMFSTLENIQILPSDATIVLYTPINFSIDEVEKIKTEYPNMTIVTCTINEVK